MDCSVPEHVFQLCKYTHFSRHGKYRGGLALRAGGYFTTRRWVAEAVGVVRVTK